MPGINTIVMGCQWGDEGKGKLVDVLAANADVIVRFQGGANAGHTVIVEQKQYVLHLLPSGILRKNTLNIIGNGCVIDIEQLSHEIKQLQELGFIITPENLNVSMQAHMVTHAHKVIDVIQGKEIGTTGRGIGPCYADKSKRNGIRLESIITGELQDKLQKQFSDYDTMIMKLHHETLPDKEQAIKRHLIAAETIKPFIKDTPEIIAQAIHEEKNVLFEGAQGTMLDIDHGTYPYVTSSNTTIGGAYSGSGVFVDFDHRIAVLKAYTTRVGNGPFPTEQNNEIGKHLSEVGHEFGATTGRARRCGWLDLHLVKRAMIINGFNRIALTKLDCLTGLNEIKIAIGRNGNDITYKSFQGWKESLDGATSLQQLPQSCQDYVKYIEEFLEVPIYLISTGPRREDHILREQ